jgi:hypothetical protein
MEGSNSLFKLGLVLVGGYMLYKWSTSKPSAELMYEPGVTPLVLRSAQSMTPREQAAARERHDLFEQAALDWYMPRQAP